MVKRDNGKGIQMIRLFNALQYLATPLPILIGLGSLSTTVSAQFSDPGGDYCTNPIVGEWYKCGPDVTGIHSTQNLDVQFMSANTCDFLKDTHGADANHRVQGIPEEKDIGTCFLAFKIADENGNFKYWHKQEVTVVESDTKPFKTPEEYISAGLLNVTEPPTDFGLVPVTPGLASDENTDAIEKAITKAHEENLVAYFPYSDDPYWITYPIVVRQLNDHDIGGTNNKSRIGVYILGGVSDAGERPVFRAQNGKFGQTCTNYDGNPNSPGTGCRLFTEREKKLDQRCGIAANKKTTIKPLIHIYRENPSCKNQPESGDETRLFTSGLKNIDFDLGSNNPDAVAIRLFGSESTFIENVKINARDSFAGLYEAPGSGGTVQNLEVVGGKHAVFLPRMRAGGTLFVGLKLSQQQYAPIVTPFKDKETRNPLTIVGFDFTLDSNPLVSILSSTETGGNYQNMLGLIDGSITVNNPTNSDHIINGDKRAIFIKNVYIKGHDKVLSDRGETKLKTGTSLSSWYRINTFAFEDNSAGKTGTYGKIYNGSTTPTEMYDNGVMTNSTVIANSIVSSPESDLVSRHIKPWDFCNLEDPANTIAAVADGENDRNKITSAISQAKAKNNVVVIPHGRYELNNTVNLEGRIKLCGVSQFGSILSSDDWVNDTLTPLITTNNVANGTAAISELKLDLTHPKSTALEWKNGTMSIVNAPWVWVGEASESGDLQPGGRQRTLIKGNGGGRWYGYVGMKANKHLADPATRHLMIDGTSQATRFYGIHAQYLKPKGGNPMVEVKNSTNIWFLSGKNENTGNEENDQSFINAYQYNPQDFQLFLGINNSEDILFVGMEGKMFVGKDRGLIEIDGNSSNITIANITRRNKFPTWITQYTESDFYTIRELKPGTNGTQANHTKAGIRADRGPASFYRKP
jgi:hypothetical protein